MLGFLLDQATPVKIIKIEIKKNCLLALPNRLRGERKEATLGLKGSCITYGTWRGSIATVLSQSLSGASDRFTFSCFQIGMYR